VCSYVNTHQTFLPSSLRGRVPAQVLLGVGALALTLSTVAVVRLAKSANEPRSIVEAARANADASEASSAKEAPTASERTESAPAAVAPSAPSAAPSANATDESTLLLNLASTFASEGRGNQAVAVIERALLRNPELRSDERVGKILLQTAQSDDKSTSNASFALLEGPMGERGAQLMYELSLMHSGTDNARKHVEGWLRSKDFVRVAPLPLYVLVKMRQAKSCEDMRALLGLASAGDRQTLDYLRQIQAHTTCSPDDLVNCYPCMRADNRLSDAIASIEKRLR
jgi:hypothetical protein